MEQIAGDLLPAGAPNAASWPPDFWRSGPKPLAQQDRVQMIYDVVDEQIDTTSKAFMGLTVACARCHDHKFDPILTKDYYALASIFASTEISAIWDGRARCPISITRRSIRRRTRATRRIAGACTASSSRWRRRWRGCGPRRCLGAPKIAEAIEAAWKSRNASDKWVKLFENDKAKATYAKKWQEADAVTIKQVAEEYAESYNKAAKKWDGQLENWRKRYAAEVAQSALDEGSSGCTSCPSDGPRSAGDETVSLPLPSELDQAGSVAQRCVQVARALKVGPSLSPIGFTRQRTRENALVQRVHFGRLPDHTQDHPLYGVQ